MKLTKRKFIFPALMALTIAVSGCGLTGGDDSVTNPAASTLRPTGTVQGVVMDSVTQQPIAGAVVDIDGLTATTNDKGQYSLPNVPATCDQVEGSTNTCENVTATIDLRRVTSPVNMTNVVSSGKCTKEEFDTTGKKVTVDSACYPQFAYNEAQINYTSLNDSSQDGNTDGTQGDSSTNHDTPVTGLMTSMDVSVGKLDANITGKVVDATVDAVGNTVYDFVAGAEVNLYSNGSANSGNAGGAEGGGSGASRHLVSTTTTDASGSFTFSNIEAFQSFTIEASASGSVLFGAKLVTAPADEQTLKLDNLQANPAAVCSGLVSLNPCFPVVVNTQDANPPFIKSVNLENGADLDATDVPLHVTYTFSEAIAKTAYSAPELADDAATTDKIEVASANGVANLADALQVNFLGTKAGNIAHSIYWNAAMTELHVEIPALAASSAYNVTVAAALGNLLDSTGNSALDPNGLATINFTTNGGSDVAAPAITITNSASLQTSVIAVVVDWIPVSGAKEYNVYVAEDEVWDTTQEGQFILADTVQISNATVNVNFVEDAAIKLVNRIKVRAVNSDGVESADSNVVTAQDNVGASINNAAPNNTEPATGLALPADGGSDTGSMTVFFNEFVNETTAETLANYSIARDDDAIASLGGDPTKIDTSTECAVQLRESVPTIASVSQLAEGNPALGVFPSVTLTLSISNPSGDAAAGACDLNGDGDTTDAGESIAAGPHVYNGAFTVTIDPELTDVAGNAPNSLGNNFNNATGTVE